MTGLTAVAVALPLDPSVAETEPDPDPVVPLPAAAAASVAEAGAGEAIEEVSEEAGATEEITGEAAEPPFALAETSEDWLAEA